jgi:hypothetical protein
MERVCDKIHMNTEKVLRNETERILRKLSIISASSVSKKYE